MEKYPTLSLDLKMAIEMGIRDLNVYGDSQLVINQLFEEYKVKKEDCLNHANQSMDCMMPLNGWVASDSPWCKIA